MSHPWKTPVCLPSATQYHLFELGVLDLDLIDLAIPLVYFVCLEKLNFLLESRENRVYGAPLRKWCVLLLIKKVSLKLKIKVPEK